MWFAAALAGNLGLLSVASATANNTSMSVNKTIDYTEAGGSRRDSNLLVRQHKGMPQEMLASGFTLTVNSSYKEVAPLVLQIPAQQRDHMGKPFAARVM
jgi:hypothetical protein